MKYESCKGSEVDLNLADGPSREGCGKQYKARSQCCTPGANCGASAIYIFINYLKNGTQSALLGIADDIKPGVGGGSER